jgi:NADH-quinone oxidoreductase subunit A
MREYIWVVIFGVVGVIFVLGAFVTNYLLAPKLREEDKTTPYECGEKLLRESAWVPIPLAYYLIALAFLVFDVECIFLFLWALVFFELGWFGIIEVFIFIIILLLGLVFLWKERGLLWHKDVF